MIISSKIRPDKWIWIKIPKTGTRAYADLFHPGHLTHFHTPFHELYSKHQYQYSGVTVVRHPVSRFISALKHLASLGMLGDMPVDCIENIVNFMYDNFERRGIPRRSFKEIFKVTQADPETSLYFQETFLKQQVYWAYHPKVKWFKYETIADFNFWIEQELGINTSELKRKGAVANNILQHLNFTDNKFHDLVEYLFPDDYVVYNYRREV